MKKWNETTTPGFSSVLINLFATSSRFKRRVSTPSSVCSIPQVRCARKGRTPAAPQQMEEAAPPAPAGEVVDSSVPVDDEEATVADEEATVDENTKPSKRGPGRPAKKKKEEEVKKPPPTVRPSPLLSLPQPRHHRRPQRSKPVSEGGRGEGIMCHAPPLARPTFIATIAELPTASRTCLPD